MKKFTLVFGLMITAFSLLVFIGCPLDGENGQIQPGGPEASQTSYLEARALMNDLFDMDVEHAELIDEMYDLLLISVFHDPNNTDAILYLAFFDIMHFLVDDDVQGVFTDGFGFENYPKDMQEMYISLVEMVTGTLSPESFWKDYSEDDTPLLLPFMTNFNINDPAPEDFISHMLGQLLESEYNLNDVFANINNALGSSFERTMELIENLDANAKFAVTQTTFPEFEDDDDYDWEDGEAFYFTAAEAKILGSQLYMIRAYGNMLNALELGFNLEAIIEYDDDSWEFIEYSYETKFFADNFLQADEESIAYLSAAKEDILKANRMVRSAFEEISERTEEDDDLVLSPSSELFSMVNQEFDDVEILWDDFENILNFMINWLDAEYESIHAGGGELAVFPFLDMSEAGEKDMEEVLREYFEKYADSGNWPSEAEIVFVSDKDITGIFVTAAAFDLGVVFSSELNLLGSLLSVGADGEPKFYEIVFGDNGEEGQAPDIDSIEVVTETESEKPYFLKIPDLTFNGLVDQSNNPFESWNDVNDLIFEMGMYLVEENGAVSLYINEMLFAHVLDVVDDEEEWVSRRVLDDGESFWIIAFEAALAAAEAAEIFD